MKRINSALRSGFPDKALSILKDFDSTLSLTDIKKLLTISGKLDAVQIHLWIFLNSIHRFELIPQ